MSKAALARLVAQKHGLSKADADKIVTTVFDGITSTLVSQGQFSYVGFGRMQVVDRAGRPGRNPATGDPLYIKARRVVKFTTGQNLKREINDAPKKTKPK